MRPMVFVPLTVDGLRELLAGAAYAGVAYAATPGLREAYALPAGDDEEADHVAQLLASLAGVRDGAPRLVAAAEVAALPPAEDEPAEGRVRVAGLPWRDVRALFVDDPDDPPARAVLEAALAGDLAALDPHPLLWFAPSESAAVLDQLTRTQGA